MSTINKMFCAPDSWNDSTICRVVSITGASLGSRSTGWSSMAFCSEGAVRANTAASPIHSPITKTGARRTICAISP
ncbi:Uncharacterised protein [Mycobacteroides abscessus subsp. abscessus]|nr:Uncharacterised protein [Mycobacteroides abscessus subsp. abscessus]